MKARSVRGGAPKFFQPAPPASRIPIVQDVFHGKKMLPFLSFSLTELAVFHMLITGPDESEIVF